MADTRAAVEEQKKKDEEKKRDDENKVIEDALKKSQDEQNALQEKIRTLAGVMTRKVELAQARIDKKKARMAVV